jgi:demethylmenaquinone methyltransferase / 2-methoxy-6-polyprenyl-1,4-benzoquinol methylase
MSAPHPPLKEYYASEAERGGWVRRLFDRTAGDYDRIEHAMAFGTGSWYRRRALLRSGLSIGMRVLDIGTGTGLTACEAARIVGDPTLVVGVDPSPGMVDCAKVPAGLILKIGTAEAIPADAAAAEFLTMGYALRHIGDLSAWRSRNSCACSRPAGASVCSKSRKPPGRIARALLKAYMRGVVPLLASMLGAASRYAAIDALLLGHDRDLHAARGDFGADARGRLRHRAPPCRGRDLFGILRPQALMSACVAAMSRGNRRTNPPINRTCIQVSSVLSRQ